MFESIDIQKVANGYIVSITTEDGETRQYVYDTTRKVMRCLKQFMDAGGKNED